MFRPLLTKTVNQTPSAIGAMFLDWDGESVEVVAAQRCSPDDLKIIGAYQGIFLTQVRRICRDLAHGVPERFKLELTSVMILCSFLKDGYYVVLLLRRTANEGMAWRHLLALRERLITEL